MSDADLKLPLLDEQGLVELREVMGDRFVDLVSLFLDDLPLQIDRLRAAFIQDDAGELYRAAHKFKSSCSVIGAARLAELIQRLELAGRHNTLDSATELLLMTQMVADETTARLRAQLD